MNTKLRLSTVLPILATLSLATPADAQEVTKLPDTSRHAIGLDAGLEGAFVSRATYAHRIDLGVLNDTRLFGRLTLPFIAPDFGDWGVDAGIRTTPLAWRDLRLAVMLGPAIKNTSNEMFSATALGVGATALFGYEGARWGLSAELGYEQLLSTHVQHSDLYRQIGYAGAKNGWYALSGSTAHGGLRGGVRFGAIEIAARAGVDTTGRLSAVTPPFYATLGSSYAF